MVSFTLQWVGQYSDYANLSYDRLLQTKANEPQCLIQHKIFNFNKLIDCFMTIRFTM